jgi:hypothetical protein
VPDAETTSSPTATTDPLAHEQAYLAKARAELAAREDGAAGPGNF